MLCVHSIKYIFYNPLYFIRNRLFLLLCAFGTLRMVHRTTLYRKIEILLSVMSHDKSLRYDFETFSYKDTPLAKIRVLRLLAKFVELIPCRKALATSLGMLYPIWASICLHHSNTAAGFSNAYVCCTYGIFEAFESRVFDIHCPLKCLVERCDGRRYLLTRSANELWRRDYDMNALSRTICLQEKCRTLVLFRLNSVLGLTNRLIPTKQRKRSRLTRQSKLGELIARIAYTYVSTS
ncbi:hypothetical protein RIR_jg41683.t1 [Rhizophagus irregularis DAOM 181602=DAOM 197198]|nr:hypothetical protein RIR_jg41683.t1 [Rhizophagus irregularis DAOM 181602=DAOM 197198]